MSLLGGIIETFLIEKKLPFNVSSNQNGDNIFHSEGPYCGRHRAIIWEPGREAGPSLYFNNIPGPCVTIYNVNPDRNYTAIGDRRCDLSVADPTFFEQLESHLLRMNE